MLPSINVSPDSRANKNDCSASLVWGMSLPNVYTGRHFEVMRTERR
jgi:hypothetical protein